MLKNFGLILGGSKGIGFEVANQMLAKNYHIILNSRNPFEAYNELRKNYSEDKIILLPGDISEDSTLKNLVDILENINKLDSILINYGGPNIKPFHEITHNEWLNYFKTMFLSPIEIIKNTINYLKNSEYPRIVAKPIENPTNEVIKECSINPNTHLRIMERKPPLSPAAAIPLAIYI